MDIAKEFVQILMATPTRCRSTDITSTQPNSTQPEKREVVVVPGHLLNNVDSQHPLTIDEQLKPQEVHSVDDLLKHARVPNLQEMPSSEILTSVNHPIAKEEIVSTAAKKVELKQQLELAERNGELANDGQYANSAEVDLAFTDVSSQIVTDDDIEGSAAIVGEVSDIINQYLAVISH